MKLSTTFVVACLVIAACLAGLPCIKGQTATWSDWTACTKLCGIGESYRTCPGTTTADCGGGATMQYCNPQPCVNCTVSYFGGYSTCTKPCGSGLRWRARYIITAPEPGGTPCPQLNYTSECNTYMCYETITGKGFWYYGPFRGPGPLTYTITRIDTEIDVFLFDQENFNMYQFDVQLEKPLQTGYVPVRAALDIETVKQEGPITLDPNTDYYLVIDHTKIGAAAGSTDGNGNQVFLNNRFYYSISGVEVGVGAQSIPVISGATAVVSSSLLVVALAAIALLF